MPGPKTGGSERQTGALKGGPERLRCLLLGSLALAGCASFSSLSSSENDDTALTPSQSNLTSLSAVVEKHPDDPQAYNVRGSVLAEAGHPEEALADFNKAISLDANYAQAYANRALLYRHTGKPDLALADYNKALSIDGSYVPAVLGRGISTVNKAGARRRLPT